MKFSDLLVESNSTFIDFVENKQKLTKQLNAK